MKEAIYPGSFDPFTNGHLDIVKKASELFDRVAIVIAVNNNKSRVYDVNKMCKAIKSTLAENNIINCTVGYWNGLTADLMHQWNAKYLIRGLRNNMDYNYEENIAKINKMIDPEIQTIYLRAESDISSSMVKELHCFEKDISDFVPEPIYRLMRG